MRALVACAALSLLAASSLDAQTRAPSDSAATDSAIRAAADAAHRLARHDSAGRPCDFQGPDMPLQLIVFELGLAPSLLASTPELIRCRRDDRSGPSVGFAHAHLAVHAVLGADAAYDTSGVAFVGDVEARWRSALVEYREQSIELPHTYHLRTVAVGYLEHPFPELMAGATFGYRFAPGLPGPAGVAIGFPIVWGGPRKWARIESAYVMNTHMTSWNYRLAGEWRLGDGPFTAGFEAEVVALELARRGRTTAVPLGARLGVLF